jgi:glycosyltransferase involved in cell wall biosynthesis
LIVSGNEGLGPERYRVLHKRELLELHGQSCAIIGVSRLESRFSSPRELREMIEPADIVIFHRTPISDVIGEMLRETASQGKPAVFDVDDLVFEPELTQFHRGVELLSPADQVSYHEGVRRYRQMLESCDYFLGATDYLAELARRRGRVAFVERNCLSRRYVAEAAAARRWVKKPTSTVVIGYSSGTRTHNHDFLEAATALVEILARYPQVRLSVLGPLDLDARFLPFADRIEQVAEIPWDQVPHVVARWDINLAPLEIVNPFCRCKSELKYFEAGILGVPTVASKIEAFECAIQEGRNGFLCASKDEWYEALRRLTEDPALRARIGREAEVHTIAHYAPRQRAAAFVHLLERIIEHNRCRPDASAARREPAKSLQLGWLMTMPASGSEHHRTILRQVQLLNQCGHRSTLYLDGGGRFTFEDDAARFLRDEFFVSGAAVELGFEHLANCDALIATDWSTARVVQASDCSSRKLYFVQDYEPHAYPMGSEWIQADESYRLGLRCITVGRWLTNLLRVRHEADADYVDFTVDTARYYPRSVPRQDPPIVCALARPEDPRRGFGLVVKALERLHRIHPETEIVLYGSREIPRSLPFPFENAGRLSPDQCAELYSRATVGVSLSLGNPAATGFEMMACGCAVVDLDLENNHFDHGAGGTLVLARPDPDSIARAVAGLLVDPEHRRAIAAEGRRHVLSRHDSLSARRFEEHVLRTRLDLFNSHSRDVCQLRQTGLVGELIGGRDVAQSFVCSRNYLCRIDLFMAGNARSNDTRVTLSLRRETPDGQEVARATVPVASFRENHWMRFEFEPILVSEGKSFVIRVQSPDGIPGQWVSFCYTSDPSLKDGQLWIAGQEQPGALMFRTYCLRRCDLLPNRPTAPVVPPAIPEPAVVIGAGRHDFRVTEIVRTIQRINRKQINEVQDLRSAIHEKEEYIHRLQTHLAHVTSSRSWRAISRVRGILRTGRNLVRLRRTGQTT